jgi:hypothetical protein
MLLPMHFACDLSGLGSIAGNGDTKSYFQFRRMAAVSVWLLKKMGSEGAKAVEDVDLLSDAPLMVAKKLLVAAQLCGVSPSELADILPTALIQGYGDKVCVFLTYLTKRALITAKHTWSPLTYKHMVRNENTEQNRTTWIESNDDNDNGDFLNVPEVNMRKGSR